ncbi:MAG TPA: Arc family DNA-binding protein [Limosilactobacillus coleohominis]|nr:Arc family DNA-binding protein [Limosilactobacillus coleohominis]
MKQLTLRLPDELYEAVKREAKLNGSNLNEELRTRLISDYLHKPAR